MSPGDQHLGHNGVLTFSDSVQSILINKAGTMFAQPQEIVVGSCKEPMVWLRFKNKYELWMHGLLLTRARQLS